MHKSKLLCPYLPPPKSEPIKFCSRSGCADRGGGMRKTFMPICPSACVASVQPHPLPTAQLPHNHARNDEMVSASVPTSLSNSFSSSRNRKHSWAEIIEDRIITDLLHILISQHPLPAPCPDIPPTQALPVPRRAAIHAAGLHRRGSHCWGPLHGQYGELQKVERGRGSKVDVGHALGCVAGGRGCRLELDG